MSRDRDDSAAPVAIDDVDTAPVLAVRRILVVDDIEANLIAAEAALAPLGRPLIMARSGQEALARLLEHDFALVLLDIQMPDMDGYETAKWIRSRPRSKHTPIIFMTAHDHDNDAVMRGYELGAVDFLFKPVSPEVLRAKAAVFVMLLERTEQLLAERLEREFETKHREYETRALRRERDREIAAKLELARLNEALAASDRLKDSFLATLAHELRNPLAPVRMCVDAIRDDPGRAFDGRTVGILDRQLDTLTRLVDDLLDLSRIKADKIELRPELLDLGQLLDEIVATHRVIIAERAHAIELVVPASPLGVVVDRVRVTQVITNLLLNAVRYTPRGGRIVVTASSQDTEAIVRVADNGIGIPLDLQPSIFELFVQERVASDGSGGLGLGLALALRLVHMHAGSITVQSEGRGHGTTFEVRLPLAGTPRAFLPRQRSEAPPVQLAAPPNARAIVVDDNDDARELVADLLRRHGYQVSTAVDGPSAVRLICEQKPDAAILDLGLPGLDGVGVVDALRRECPDLPTRLIALTGYGEVADRERTSRVGFDAHLTKPASARALLACIAQQLTKRE